MRVWLTLFLMTSACGAESAESTAEPAVTTPAPAPTAPEPAAAAPAAQLTEGFISLKVDGQAMRFEHAPAEDNTAMPQATRVTARANVSGDHGARLILMGIDVRAATLPASFQMVPPSRENGMRPRMPTVEYYDETGARFVAVGAQVDCASLEEHVLRCSFGELRVRNPRTDATLTLSEGEVEMALVYDEAVDQAARLLGGATGTQ